MDFASGDFCDPGIDLHGADYHLVCGRSNDCHDRKSAGCRDLVADPFVFVGFSGAVVFTRPIATKYFNQNRVKTNLDSLIGKQAVVTASIRNLQEEGRVMIDGKEWTARSADASRTIEKDQIVRILSIQGVKLIVEPSEENNH